MDHRPAPSSTPTSGVQHGDPAQKSSCLNLEAQPFTPPTTTSLYIDSSKAVLLQTPRAFVYNPSTRQGALRVRLLLVTGSQSSFITTRVKHELSLAAEKEQKVSVVTFGSERKHIQSCEVVRVGLKTIHGPDKEIELHR